MKIAQAHPEEMERVGTDKRTVLEVIMSGSAYQHYAYLMNGCQVMHELPAASRRTLAWGTTGNEAVHWQMKSWHANVRIQHGERVQRTMKVFSLVKMLIHNAAAYSPTLSQHSQGHVLSTIIGGIRRGFFKPVDSDKQPEHVTRALLTGASQVSVTSEEVGRRERATIEES